MSTLRPFVIATRSPWKHWPSPRWAVFFSTTTPFPSDSLYFSSVEQDRICELASSHLRFGPGATAEMGPDLRETHGCRGRVVVFGDARLRTLPGWHTLYESLTMPSAHGETLEEVEVYDRVRVEPNEVSFRDALHFLQSLPGGYDAIVALGGGSVLDTAKAANLYACHPPTPTEDDPDGFYQYVNPPIGRGYALPAGPLKPLIAIPTTAGTGSETTGVAIFDDTPTRSKTGLAHRALKPTLAVLDPDHLVTVPAVVAAYTGLDVLCHAMESYTARPFNQRRRPLSPRFRPTYQGSNPISDVWSLHALRTTVRILPRMVARQPGAHHLHPSSPPVGVDDDEKVDLAADRAAMLLASSAAGLGFGNAEVHLCHGMSYPISSQVPSTYISAYAQQGVLTTPATLADPSVYPSEPQHALIPHGLSVIVNAPAVFHWTAVADPERHATCARILQAARTGQAESAVADRTDVGAWLAEEIRYFCRERLGLPSLSLRQFGYRVDDLPAMVEATLRQHRVTQICPREVTRPDLERLFLQVWEEE